MILWSCSGQHRTHAYTHCKPKADASICCRKRCPYCTALTSPGCRLLLLWSSNNWLLVCIIKQGMIDIEGCRMFNWLLALSPNPFFLMRMQRSGKQYTVWYYCSYLLFVCIQTCTQDPLCKWSVFWEFAPRPHKVILWLQLLLCTPWIVSWAVAETATLKSQSTANISFISYCLQRPLSSHLPALGMG